MRVARPTLTGLMMLMMAACDGGVEHPVQGWELAVQGIYAGAISTNGELSLIGSLNHGASLWRNTDHERLFDWAHEAGQPVELVAAGISPDGTRAVTTDPRTLVLWDTRTGAALGYWATPSTVLDLDVVRDDRRVLMGLSDHSAVLFDAESGEYLHTFLHDGKVTSVDVADAADLVITGSADHTARLWSLETGTLQHELSHSNPVTVVALSPSGRYAFSASENELVAIWDAASGERVGVISTRNRGVTAARFSGDDKFLLIGYVNRMVELWDTSPARVVQTWQTEARNPWHPTGAAVLDVAFTSRAGTYYVLSGDGRRLELSQS